MRTALLILLLAGLLVACNAALPAITYDDLPAEGDAARGETLFNQPAGLAPPCAACHNPAANASPDLTGYGARAGNTVAGEDARQYTFYSIVEPGRYIVEGFGNAMYNQYGARLTAQDIADLIAYLLTL